MRLLEINQITKNIPTLSIAKPVSGWWSKQETSATSSSYRAGQRRLRTENIQRAQPVNPDYIRVLIQYGNLSNAVKAQDINAVTLFLENGANPNERSNIGCAEYVWTDRLGYHQLKNEGMTPLDLAAKTENLEMAKLLLKFGADPTILRRIDFNRHIVPDYRDINMNEPYLGYISPVYIALQDKNYGLLEEFSKCGTDLNKFCLRYRLDLNEKKGTTPLNIAIHMKDSQAIEILVHGGAKP